MAAQAPVPTSGADSGARRRRRQGLLRRILLRGGRLTRIARRAVGCAGAGLLAFAAAAPAQAQGCQQAGPGAFVCAGPIAQAQSLSAEDGPLTATLSGDDPVNVTSGTALTLTGDRSVHLVQVSGAAPIRGAEAGVRATLRRDGSLTIDLAGSVTGGASGIVASATGGAARIAVAGTVEGTARHGILAEANSVAVRAGTARGALSGVHAVVGSGTAAIVVDAAAATASGTGVSGVHLRTGAGAAGATVSAGRIASGGHGIVIQHAGSATASVAADAVRAAADGIAVIASGSGGVDIRVAAVDAASGTAIRLEGSFTGGAAISATGRIAGGGDAVRVQSDAAAGALGTRRSLAISVTEAAGGANGVWASFDGDGDLAVSATGSVTGGAGHGIRAATGARTRRLTISAADVSGAAAGIHAVHEGRSMLSIAAIGSVTGAAAEGIRAVAHPGAGAGRGDASAGLRIAAATVSGATYGIHAANRSTGPMTISATGPVSGRARNGLTVLGGRTASPTTVSAALVSGGIDGARFEHFGPGDLTVSIARSVAEQHTGVLIIRGGGGNTQLTVGSVKSARTGVHIQTHGWGTHALSVGSVESSTEYGVNLNNGFNNSISLSATGTIIARGHDGIKNFSTNHSWPRGNDATNSVTIANATVTGTRNGIYSRNGGNLNLSISASGPVTGLSQAGIQIYSVRNTSARRTTISATDVTGGSWGIKTQHYAHGRLSIATSGSVTGRTRDGIEIIARDPTLHEYGLPKDIAITTASVTGAENGIEVSNELSGTLAISATGPVTGKSGTGIWVSGGSAAQSVTISAASVSGFDAGIHAVHMGHGDLRISVTGKAVAISATAGVAIRAEGLDRTGHVSVSAASATGGKTGILARNLGTGSLRVTATGDVVGKAAEGIRATNERGVGVTVAAASVDGATYGIAALSNGTGDLSVAAAGSVIGRGGEGIRAFAEAGGRDLTIAAASVTGSSHGIFARNRGSGTTSVSATGMAAGGSAADLHGVLAYNTATGAGVSVSVGGARGSKTGVTARNEGAGSLMVAATGSVTGGASHGIHARNADRGASLTVAAAAVAGGGHGILAMNLGSGATSVSATGMVAGGSAADLHGVLAYNTATGAGVSVSVGGARGSKTGVTARNEGAGSLMVAATGSVMGGTSHGIHARNAGRGASLTVTAAAVAGGAHGILAENLGSGATSVSATGPIKSGSGGLLHGIVVHNTESGGSVAVVAGDVLGARTGIDAQNLGTGTLSVTATGFVRGGGYDGIAVRNASGGTGLTVRAADVSGHSIGISANHRGAGDLSVTATGMVRGGGGWGISATNHAGVGSLTIAAASVIGGVAGITALNRGTGATSVTATGHVESVITDYNYRGDGISVTAYHGDVAVAAADVTGQQNGIWVSASGAGRLSVAATGTVRGFYGDGIGAFSGSSGTGLAISVASAVGVQSGIVAKAEGGGPLFVAATGRVTGHNADGVLARNGASGSSLTVSVASVTGREHGIFAENRGIGITRVSATGLVTGGDKASKHGILAQNAETGAGILVSATQVRGGGGIAARNAGAGDISVISTGSITANSDNGIFADNGRRGGNVTVTASTVTGGASGIFASNLGSGATSISATGRVSGGTGLAAHGIYAFNSAAAAGAFVSAATVTGGGTGITVKNEGVGGLSITASGSVTGRTDNGVLAINRARGANLTVRVASVTGVRHGIQAENLGTGATRVTATGMVAGGMVAGGSRISLHGILAFGGAAGTGVFVSAADVRGGDGITAHNLGAGDVSVAASGSVTAESSFGVFASNGRRGGSLTVAVATVAGQEHGIMVSNFGSGATSVSATGPVSGGTGATTQGIFAFNSAAGVGVAVSAATVTGGATGITARNDGAGTLSIAAFGSVTGRADHGVVARNSARGSSLTVSVAVVTGRRHGILAQNHGTGATSVSAAGPVAGGPIAGLHGILAHNTPIGSGVSVSAASVTGGGTGITVKNEGAGGLSITASRSVTGRTDNGVLALNRARGANLTVRVASVTGVRHGIQAENLGTGATRVTATGMVAGGSRISLHGIFAYGGATGTGVFVSAADVRGGDGITAQNLGAGDVSVAASGSVTAESSFGVFASNGRRGGSLTVAVATVAGQEHGIMVSNFGSGATSVSATGPVSGGTGTTTQGIFAFNSAAGVGVAVSAATVTGGATGITARNDGAGTLAIATSGSVTGRADHGVVARNGTRGSSLTVSVAEVTGRGHGILAQNHGTGATSVSAAGQVAGGPIAGLHGILAHNTPIGSGVSVSAASVWGAQTGITARNEGSGGLAVTASGSVTAGSGTGIDAIGGLRGSGVRVEADRVSGALHGIRAIGSGTGPLRVAATGDIVGGGAGHDGIHVQGAPSGSDLMVSATAAVIGESRGIRADNRGSGATVVSAGGPVSGGRGDGIAVDAGATAGRVVVSVASVSGGGNGLIARSLGSGAMRVRASERVAGHRGDGIAASGNGGLNIDVRAVEGHSAGVVAANGGRGSVVIAAADTVTGRGGGGIVATNGADGLNLEISAAEVRGATSGIAAENFGSGALSVAAAGLVASHEGTGIRAYNGMSGIDLAVSGRSVSAQGHGIDAVNRGAGDLSIRLAGDAESDLASGISARNSEAGVGLSVGAATAIGRRNGIFARNMGIGDLSVAVAGAVSGATRDGLHAYNGRFGLSLTVSAGSVEGFDNGVFARNVGNGALSVAVSSRATGGLNTGIRAHNSASGTDLTVAAGSASGRRFGIFAENRGHGSLSIVASGAVSGIVDDGLHAVNGASGSDLTISATEVSGRTMGIRAENDGSGSLRISATRNVSGGAGGAVLARSGARGSDVDVQIAAATGNSFGIKVRSMGLGAVKVAATGAVAAKTDDGIHAYGGPATLGLAIRAAGARGRERGIQAHLEGSGPVLVAATGAVAGVRGSGILARSGSRGDRIEVSAGTVSGGTNGIEVISENRQDILISASGAVTGGTGAGVVAMTRGGRAVVTLRSGASAGAASGVAIRNNDDSVNVTAMAGSAIRGAVLLGGGADALAFDGGRLDPDALLDGGSDPVSAKGPESIDVLRLGGRHRGLIARHLRNWERIVVEAKGLVSFHGRQTLRTGVFHNHGTLSMRDGNADDSLTIDGSFAGGGSLVLDVDFALGRADRLTITGNALGAATAVTVSKTGGSDSGADGAIALIGVGGATAADAFALSGGELRSGSRAYRLAYLTDRREFALVPSPAAAAAAGSGWAQTPAAIPKAAAESEAAIGALPSVASAFINSAPSQTNPPVPTAPAQGAGAPAGSSPQGGFPTPNVAKAAVAPLSQAGAAPAIAAPTPAMAGAALPVPASRNASTRAANSASAPAASAKAPAATQAATIIPARASGSPAAPRAEESAAASASAQAARPARAAATETAALPSMHGTPAAESAPAPVASGSPSAPAPATSAAAPTAAQSAKADPARANGAPAAPRAEESTAAPAAMTMPSTRSANTAAIETAAPPSAHDTPPAKPAPVPVASGGPTSASAPATSAAAPTAAQSAKTDPARTKESAAAPTVAPMRADPAAATTAQDTAAQLGAGVAPKATAPEVAANADNSGSTTAQTVPDVAKAATASPAARTDDTPAFATAATTQGAGAAPKAEADTPAAAPARDRAESAGNPDGGAASSGGASAVFLRMASVALLEGFARTPTHLQRRWESGDPDSGGIWMLTRDNAGGYADTAAGAVMTTRGGSVQGGTILAKIDGQRGDWIFGAKARRAHLSAVVHEREGAGTMESQGYGTGVTATWLGRSGIYLDLQAQINRIQSEFLFFREGPPASGAKSRIYGTSIEAGAPVPVREGLTALPHAQIGWSRLESAPVAKRSAEAASLETGEMIFARIGLGLELRTENIDARLTGSLLRDFSGVPGDGAHARASSATRAEFGIGATVSLGGGALLVKATHRMPLESDGSGGGSSLSAGMRWSWN